VNCLCKKKSSSAFETLGKGESKREIWKTALLASIDRFSNYDDMELEGESYVTVPAGKFYCYHFYRTSGYKGLALLDEYAIDRSYLGYSFFPKQTPLLHSLLFDSKAQLNESVQ
jgi:hypothetical protein